MSRRNTDKRQVGERAINPFPYLHDFTDEQRLAELGYLALPVSVFDHWLTLAEYAPSGVISYGEARTNGRLAEYLAGEERFISLYDQLAVGGISIVRTKHGRLEPVAPSGRRFRELILSSLRERRLMDLYFNGADTRVIGNWDRTDWFFCRDKAKLPSLVSAVTAAGLFVLPSTGSSV